MQVSFVQLRGGTTDESSQAKPLECTPNPNEAALFMIMLQQYAFQNQAGTKISLGDNTSTQEAASIDNQLGNIAGTEYGIDGAFPEVTQSNTPYPFLQEMESVPTDPVSIAMNTREFQTFSEFQTSPLSPKVPETKTIEIPEGEAVSGEPQQQSTIPPAIAPEELPQTELVIPERAVRSTVDDRGVRLDQIQQFLHGVEQDTTIHPVTVQVPKQKPTEKQQTQSLEEYTIDEPKTLNEMVPKRESLNELPSQPQDLKKQDTSHREQRNAQVLSPDRQELSVQDPSTQTVDEVTIREPKIQSATVKNSSTIHLQPTNARALQNTAFHEIVQQMTNQTEVSSRDNTAQIVIDQIVQTITLSVKEGTTQLKLKLQPPTLGEMLVKVKMEKGAMQTEIELTNPTTRALIEGSLPQLREALSSRGIEMQKIDIITSHQPGTGTSEQRKDFKENKVKQTSFTDEETPGDEERLRTLGYNTMEITL